VLQLICLLDSNIGSSKPEYPCFISNSYSPLLINWPSTITVINVLFCQSEEILHLCTICNRIWMKLWTNWLVRVGDLFILSRLFVKFLFVSSNYIIISCDFV
jgi:hypothetical protein